MRKIAINLETQKRNASRSLPVIKSSSKLFSVRDNYQNSFFCFRVDTAQDSALAALDYVQIVDSRLTFTSGGAVIQYVDITIRDDSFIEGSEDFTATLTLLSPLATLGPVSTTRITILDNDGMLFESQIYICRILQNIYSLLDFELI